MHPLSEKLRDRETYVLGGPALLMSLCGQAADELDRQADEITTLTDEVDRLNQSLSWEQHRAGRIGTHGPNCHLWGHQHYECLLRKFNALETHPND